MNDIHEQLRAAANRGSETEVKALLLNPKCDALSKGAFSRTALMYAALNGHADCVQLLLPTSDAQAKDQLDRTALMMGSSQGHTFCVQSLLPVSDARAKDQWGRTALMNAALNGHADCLHLLLPVSELGTQDNNSATASDYAKEGCYPQLAVLIDAYALARSELLALSALSAPGSARQAQPRRV